MRGNRANNEEKQDKTDDYDKPQALKGKAKSKRAAVAEEKKIVLRRLIRYKRGIIDRGMAEG